MPTIADPCEIFQCKEARLPAKRLCSRHDAEFLNSRMEIDAFKDCHLPQQMTGLYRIRCVECDYLGVGETRLKAEQNLAAHSSSVGHHRNFSLGATLDGVTRQDAIDHPAHYGNGADDPHECIKVIAAWSAAGKWDGERGFNLGNVLKYIARLGRKAGEDELTAAKKAAWYLNHEIERLEKR